MRHDLLEALPLAPQVVHGVLTLERRMLLRCEVLTVVEDPPAAGANSQHGLHVHLPPADLLETAHLDGGAAIHFRRLQPRPQEVLEANEEAAVDGLPAGVQEAPAVAKGFLGRGVCAFSQLRRHAPREVVQQLREHVPVLPVDVHARDQVHHVHHRGGAGAARGHHEEELVAAQLRVDATGAPVVEQVALGPQSAAAGALL
mmetsp:Transcript_97642/g.304499  ORF Transcript_97642/g.304499 Transcript_97642/m.304499 type:complete len:201 (-) Transcript_97642:200-802(-)